MLWCKHQAMQSEAMLFTVDQCRPIGLRTGFTVHYYCVVLMLSPKFVWCCLFSALCFKVGLTSNKSVHRLACSYILLLD